MVSYELHVTYFYLHDLSSCIVPNNRSHDIDSNDIKIYISPFSPFSTFLGLFRRLLQPFSTFCFLCFAPKLRRRKVNVESSRPYPRNHRRPKNKTSVGWLIHTLDNSIRFLQKLTVWTKNRGKHFWPRLMVSVFDRLIKNHNFVFIDWFEKGDLMTVGRK